MRTICSSCSLDGKVDVQVQAAALERVRHLARVVAGEHDERDVLGRASCPAPGTLTWKSLSTSSRNASNSVSALSISSISSTRRLGRRDGAQQRPRQDEAVGEEDVVLAWRCGRRPRDSVCAPAEHLADLVLQDLRVEQLLGVLPLVERLGLVEALVALQPDQLVAERRRRAPWRARSCRRRPDLRPGWASRAGWRGRRRSRCGGCRCIAAARSARSPRRSTQTIPTWARTVPWGFCSDNCVYGPRHVHARDLRAVASGLSARDRRQSRRVRRARGDGARAARARTPHRRRPRPPRRRHVARDLRARRRRGTLEPPHRGAADREQALARRAADAGARRRLGARRRNP